MPRGAVTASRLSRAMVGAPRIIVEKHDTTRARRCGLTTDTDVPFDTASSAHAADPILNSSAKVCLEPVAVIGRAGDAAAEPRVPSGAGVGHLSTREASLPTGFNTCIYATTWPTYNHLTVLFPIFFSLRYSL